MGYSNNHLITIILKFLFIKVKYIKQVKALHYSQKYLEHLYYQPHSNLHKHRKIFKIIPFIILVAISMLIPTRELDLYVRAVK
jgi:hypothetical protein